MSFDYSTQGACATCGLSLGQDKSHWRCVQKDCKFKICVACAHNAQHGEQDVCVRPHCEGDQSVRRVTHLKTYRSIKSRQILLSEICMMPRGGELYARCAGEGEHWIACDEVRPLWMDCPGKAASISSPRAATTRQTEEIMQQLKNMTVDELRRSYEQLGMPKQDWCTGIDVTELLDKLARQIATMTHRD